MTETTAARVIDLLALGKASTKVAVASTGVAYGDSFPLFRGVTYSWDIQLESSGAASVKVELEQSFSRPDAEGSADTKYVIPDNKTTPVFANVADTNLHNAAYSPNATAFARFKFTGLGSNHSSTTVALLKASCIKSN